jgi:hypothetical protein
MTFGRHLSSKNPRDSQPAHVEEEDKMAQPLQSTGEERTSEDQVQKTLNIGIMPSGHHDCKKVARQINMGYCFKKKSTTNKEDDEDNQGREGLLFPECKIRWKDVIEGLPNHYLTFRSEVGPSMIRHLFIYMVTPTQMHFGIDRRRASCLC